MKILFLGLMIWVPLIAQVSADDALEQKIERKNREQEVFRAAASDDVATLERLVAQDKDLVNFSRERSTPLFEAVRSRSVNAVKFLLANGADMYVSSSSYDPLSNPFIQAIRQSYAYQSNRESEYQARGLQILQAFLDAGYNVNRITGRSGETTLHVAVKRDNVPLSVIRMLLRAKADVHATTKDGDTPLHQVRQKEVAALLIEKGANPNAKNKQGETPAEVALNREDVELARFLAGSAKQTPPPGLKPPGASPTTPTVKQLPMSSQIKLYVTRSNVSGRRKLIISVKNIGMNNLNDVEVKWKPSEYSSWRTQMIKLRPMQTEEISDANWYAENYRVELYVDGKLVASDNK